MSTSVEQLIKKDSYQVFVFECAAILPFIATHHWFVINKLGELSRWEVVFRKNFSGTSWNYLCLNAYPTFQGIEIIPFVQLYFWKAKVIGEVEGGVAKKIIEFIENSPKTYPYCNRYLFLGPNSNTYVQWILNHFPEFKIKLPWNSFGKEYKIKEN